MFHFPSKCSSGAPPACTHCSRNRWSCLHTDRSYHESEHSPHELGDRKRFLNKRKHPDVGELHSLHDTGFSLGHSAVQGRYHRHTSGGKSAMEFKDLDKLKKWAHENPMMFNKSRCKVLRSEQSQTWIQSGRTLRRAWGFFLARGWTWAHNCIFRGSPKSQLYPGLHQKKQVSPPGHSQICSSFTMFIFNIRY